ncbi:dynamin family protein [Tropicibacter naphthalenivorans]|uniref:GTP-binding protein Der n=1 Tax=Tropicibacter naphthalenivorans TaxID=441103 RepID=A0A0P1G1B8_9RHOB|nr:dynamin family protein [Tropicibacter naphthalenivorans]CUH75573.1 GTP-binding protein Der [Tropicibacter naphthalenivorans]SMC43577.1 Dynamin family protein [Tropicibacter naphthalenivorans]
MKIAPKQRQELDFLRDTLDKLEGTVDRKTRSNFRDIRERLDDWAAKVAVIGQVKAGKSTFLNAFMHMHDFLPSDVNPWTSVVTNMRINVPSDPISGARFEFFDESDWAEIVDGGSKIRKLTEQLLPGFDTEVLRRQSEEMRERAQKRLGKHYHTLLGSAHDYDFLTADLLQRYVCAGPGSDQGLDRQSLGRYAALTKVANTYMRMPEFQVPTIVTDTPGVNDPFLVRDEFTCRSLDQSDVFVVVLSAHQPLTDVDIALIRILAKQDSKDVIIFVNRIDELEDFASAVPEVVADVSRRLRAAIPEIEFNILAGSAYLADLTLDTSEGAQAARDAADTPELADYLMSKYGRVPGDQMERLYLASGLERAKSVLSHVIDTGVGSQQLAQIAEDIRAEITGTQFVIRRERDSLQMQVDSIGREVAEQAIEELESEIKDIRDVLAKLEHHVDSADSQMEKVLTKAWSGLEKRLMGQIDSFVGAQEAVIQERIFSGSVRGNAARSLDIDVAPLQAQMEREVASSYDKARASADVIMDNCIHACRQTIADKFDDPTENISLAELPFGTFTSTLTLAKKSLKIDMIADRSWAFWRQPSVNIDKSMAALRALAAEEMRPPVDKILSAFNEAAVERATAGNGRIRVMVRMIETSLSERTHRLKKDKVELEQIARDPEMQRRIVMRLQSQMEVLERRLLNLSALDGRLARPDLPQAA